MRKTISWIPLLFLASQPAFAIENMPHGLWLTENTRAIVQIAPCDDRTCGRIVWMENPVDGSGKPKLDVHNKDAILRDRPLCGLTLIGDLIPEPDDGAYFGFVYNPRNGKKYTARVTALAEDKLEMRGFLGLVALGKSQIWTRVQNDRGGCEVKKASSATEKPTYE
ncbi:MAG: DUF2147 domain-containing protein [Pseudomonadota bacterium]